MLQSCDGGICILQLKPYKYEPKMSAAKKRVDLSPEKKVEVLRAAERGNRILEA